ncbi:hypothetical protein H1R20_g6961, partial [Candolleomyces eurysporus]
MQVERASASQTPIELDKDVEYFWDFVLFSCEGHLFCVPKYRFITGSEVFPSKFGRDGHVRSGPSDIVGVDDVLELDVGAEDFRNFLRALHPKYPEQALELSKDQWLSVLQLSTKWFFNDFRRRAIDNLTAFNLDPIEKICLGTQFNVSSWLKTGFHELVTRTEIITVEDARQIGLETAIKVYGIRDLWNKSGNPCDDTTLNVKIEIAFASELRTAYDVERQHLPAREREMEEEAKNARELEKREEGQRQEEHERLQNAVAEAKRVLEENNDALEKFEKARKVSAIILPATQSLISMLPTISTPEKVSTSPATSATATAAVPVPSIFGSTSPTPSTASTGFSSAISFSAPAPAPAPAAQTQPSSTRATATSNPSTKSATTSSTQYPSSGDLKFAPSTPKSAFGTPAKASAFGTSGVSRGSGGKPKASFAGYGSGGWGS